MSRRKLKYTHPYISDQSIIRGVRLSFNTKNHLSLQHTLNMYFRFFLVKSRNMCTTSMIKIQQHCVCIKKIAFIYNHQHKYINILLNINEPLSFV